MKVVNGENLILGRMASAVAKASIRGETIAVVNCEHIILTGKRKSILEKQRSISKRRGKPTKGPFYERRPDYYVQRTVRRMLPKGSRGIAAGKRIKFYISIPEELKNSKMETIDHAHVKKVLNLNYMTIGKMCTMMGASW
jgi:large subunit ribosomal protein L13